MRKIIKKIFKINDLDDMVFVLGRSYRAWATISTLADYSEGTIILPKFSYHTRILLMTIAKISPASVSNDS